MISVVDSNGKIKTLTSVTPITQTTTLTGTQQNFALNAGVTVLQCNNATALSLGGIAAGVDGQVLLITSMGAGQVNLNYQDTGSSVANRLTNFAVSAATSLAAGLGTATYQYSTSRNTWVLVAHQQGGFIDVAYNAGNFTTTGGSGTTWTVDVGDQLTFCYKLDGQSLTVLAYLDTTSITGSASLQLFVPVPGGFTAAKKVQANSAGFDNGVGTTTYNRVGSVDFTHIETARVDLAAWANSTNNTYIRIAITFPVQ